MTKSVLSIGLLDKESKRQEISTEKALEIISTDCLKMVSGVTIIPNCIGVYTHDNGEKVIEPSIRCEFYGENNETVKRLARIFCRELNQESIAFETVEIDSEFISA